MLSAWLELPPAAALLAQWSDETGIDLIEHGTRSDAETIKDTAVAQPLIVAASLVSWLTLGIEAGPETAVAGHSVGEFAAAAIAGVLSPTQAIALVAERGRLMAKCSAAAKTGMSAIVGGNEDDVLATIAQFGLTAANVNAHGQIVAAGAQENLTGLAANPPEKARVIPLAVAGAFHTAYMDKAREGLAAAAGAISPADPHATLLSNRDGQALTSGAQCLERLVSQVTSPVHWTDCLATLGARGTTGVLELNPSGVLLGLVKRELSHVERLGLDSPDGLDAARAFAATHMGRTSPAAASAERMGL